MSQYTLHLRFIQIYKYLGLIAIIFLFFDK